MLADNDAMEIKVEITDTALVKIKSFAMHTVIILLKYLYNN